MHEAFVWTCLECGALGDFLALGELRKLGRYAETAEDWRQVKEWFRSMLPGEELNTWRFNPEELRLLDGVWRSIQRRKEVRRDWEEARHVVLASRGTGPGGGSLLN